MPTQYDSGILQRFADELYRQAKWIIVGTVLRYCLVVFLFMFVACFVLGIQQPQLALSNDGLVVACIVSLIGIPIGIEAGRKKAFNLKLQAQQILCQVQIEQNTREQEKPLAATQG
jgi:hypothetical protein